MHGRGAGGQPYGPQHHNKAEEDKKMQAWGLRQHCRLPCQANCIPQAQHPLPWPPLPLLVRAGDGMVAACCPEPHTRVGGVVAPRSALPQCGFRRQTCMRSGAAVVIWLLQSKADAASDRRACPAVPVIDAPHR
jgi:hypothetical protein